MPYLFLALRRRHWQHYRYQLRQIDMQRTLTRTAIWLAFVFTLHTGAMVYFEGLAAGDAIWLTLTTVLTVGYGDYAAATPFGRAATVLLIYLGGVFVLFNFAGDYFEYRAERKLAMIKGRWRWHMEDHVLVLNAPTINAERYMLGLVQELRYGRRCRDCPILLLCRAYPNGLPESFQNAGIVHFHGDASDPEDLEAADAAKAAIVIVLAEDAADKRSDEITFDVLARLRELGATGRIVAECVHINNRDRLRRAGADIVMRPIRFYPEIIVRAINSPGSELILENLFTIKEDECIGFEVPLRGLRWADVVMTLLTSGLGTAIAYAAEDGAVHTNPAPDAVVNARAVFLITKEERRVGTDDVRAALARVPIAPDKAAALARPSLFS